MAGMSKLELGVSTSFSLGEGPTYYSGVPTYGWIDREKLNQCVIANG